MPTFTFYSTWMKYITQVCDAYIAQNLANVANYVKPWAIDLLGVYVVLWGLGALLGAIEDPFNDMLKRVLKISVVFGIAFSITTYNSLITEFFLHGPDEFAAAMAHSGTATDTMGGLDAVLSQGYAIGNKFWAKAGLFNGDPGHYLLAAVVWGATLLVTGYAFFLVALAKVTLTVLIPLGAALMISLLFATTAHYFNAWLRQMSNYFLVPILVVAVNLLLLKLFGRAASAASSMEVLGFDTIIPFLLMAMVSFLALGSVLTIAAGLAGGVSLSSFGMGRLSGRLLLDKGPKAVKGAGRAAIGAGRAWAKGSQGLHDASGYVARAAMSGYGAARARRTNSISKTK